MDSAELGSGLRRLGCSALPRLLGSPRTSHDCCLPQGRLLLVVLCSLVFSAVYILMCGWACLPLCLATCLEPHLPTGSRPTVPGPLHFSGYSSVPDGKVSQPGNVLGAGLVKGAVHPPALGDYQSQACARQTQTLGMAPWLTSSVTLAVTSLL